MIVIKTKLADGIYKSQGGGQLVKHYSFKTNARNLLKAINTLAEHRTSMMRSFGNIGCGSSWIEIDGYFVAEHELQEVCSDDSFWSSSRTARARELISRVQNQEAIA